MTMSDEFDQLLEEEADDLLALPKKKGLPGEEDDELFEDELNLDDEDPLFADLNFGIGADDDTY